MDETDDPTPHVVEMPAASVTPDGSLSEITFRLSDGSKQTLRFPPEAMYGFLHTVFQMFVRAQTETARTAGHAQVTAMGVTAASAQSAVGGGRVILQVRLSSGMPLAFSLLPSVAEGLRPELFRAAKSAEKQAQQPRN